MAIFFSVYFSIITWEKSLVHQHARGLIVLYTMAVADKYLKCFGSLLWVVIFQCVLKNLRQINVYCNIQIIFMWRIVSSNTEMTKILNLWLSQFTACPSPLGAFVKSCTSHVFLWWDIFMKDQPEGGEFVLFCLIYYSLPLLKMTIFVLI